LAIELAVIVFVSAAN